MVSRSLSRVRLCAFALCLCVRLCAFALCLCVRLCALALCLWSPLLSPLRPHGLSTVIVLNRNVSNSRNHTSVAPSCRPLSVVRSPGAFARCIRLSASLPCSTQGLSPAAGALEPLPPLPLASLSLAAPSLAFCLWPPFGSLSRPLSRLCRVRLCPRSPFWARLAFVIPPRLRASVLSSPRLRAFVPSCLRASAPLRLRAFVPLRLRALFASGPVSGVLFRCSGSVCASPCLLSLVGAPLLFVSLRLRFLCAPELGIWELAFSDWFLGLAFWIGFFEIFLCILLCVYNEFFFCLAARRTSPREEGGDVTAWTVPCCCAFLFGARASLVP